MVRCFSCGSSLDEVGRVYRNTLCPSCGKDVKVCLNCRFYDPGAHWECRETISERVRDKDRANFCDFFQLATTATATKPDVDSRAVDDFKKLFGDG